MNPYEDLIGRIEPYISEKLESINVDIIFGFQVQKRKWIRIIVNPSPILNSNSGKKGFPKVIKFIQGEPNLIILEDASRLDELIVNELKEGRDVPKEIIQIFIQTIGSILKITDTINLSPNMVYISKEGIEFCGAGLKTSKSFSLFAWVSTFITGDKNFLFKEDLKDRYKLWEGRIPQEWFDKKIQNISFIKQFLMVKKWFNSTENNVDPLENVPKDLTDFFFNTIKINAGLWSHRASLMLSLLDLSTFSTMQSEQMLTLIQYWTPDLILWGRKKLLVPLNGVSFFVKLLESVQINKKTQKDVFNSLPAIIYSEKNLRSIEKNPSPTITNKKLLKTLLRFTDIEFEQRWLLEPNLSNFRNLNQLSRLKLLPLVILLLNEESGKEIISLSLGLTYLIEANQYLNDFSSDFCTWELIKKIIQVLDLPEEKISPDAVTIKLMEDLHDSIKRYPIRENNNKSEALAYLIVYQSWTLHHSIIHAIGGIFDQLENNRINYIPSEKDTPILDFAKILIKRETSTSDLIWRNLKEEWLQRYPKHPYAKIISELF